MTTTRTDPQHCTACFKKLDAHTAVEGDHVPKEGDFTVCIGCGTASKFDKDLNLVPLTPDDVTYLETEAPETLMLLNQAAFLIRQRNAQN
jgi:hypothetical protein